MVNLSVNFNYRQGYLFRKLSRPPVGRVLCGTPAHALPDTRFVFRGTEVKMKISKKAETFHTGLVNIAHEQKSYELQQSLDVFLFIFV